MGWVSWERGGWRRGNREVEVSRSCGGWEKEESGEDASIPTSFWKGGRSIGEGS